MPAAPIYRPSARVLAVGPGPAVLLLHYRAAPGEPGADYWITPGGGIRPGERAAEAAARELGEETGIRMRPDDMGPVVAYCAGQWSADGKVFAAHDSYFCVRVTGKRVDTRGQEELERSLMLGYRWWTIPELAASSDRILPAGLAGLLRGLLEEGPPAAPVRLPWRSF